MDIMAYALAKKYTELMALGISEMKSEGNKVYFKIKESGEEVVVDIPIAARTLSAPIEATESIGNITGAKTYSAGTPIEDILRDILTKQTPPTISFTMNPSDNIYDKVTGQLNSLTLNIRVMKKTFDIVTITVTLNGSVVKSFSSGVENGGDFTYVYSTPITDSTTIKVTVVDQKGLTNSMSNSIVFVGNSYYGLIDADTEIPNESIIKGLNKKLKTSKSLTYSGITTDWGKICYAYPTELGALSKITDKINNFNYTPSFTLNTMNIDGIPYNIYTLNDPVGADGIELTFE